MLAGKRLANYLSVLTLECQTIARANGKSHVHNLEPEDLVALTVEAAAMAHVPLAGTDRFRGGGACDLGRSGCNCHPGRSAKRGVGSRA